MIILFLAFIGIDRIEAQEQENIAPKEPRLTTSGVSYMEPTNPEKHSKFVINYRVSSNLFLEVRGQYDVYPIVNVFKSALIAKRYISNNTYLFSGGEIEWTRVVYKDLLPIPNIPTQYRSINGIGYDVNSYFTMEVQKDFYINATNLSPFSNPDAFSIKGTLKF
ncbi:hypothetical protein JJQ60_05485 [Aquimarina mytili]|uniref:Uncharacterized protein n=2 Tax=Aquimarina mytili TaxID=874423 RepID=A0A936ZVH2_9FLAO|nr:hypothetical protein [Aquimarina mytili]